jgi:hypothetical protein
MRGRLIYPLLQYLHSPVYGKVALTSDLSIGATSETQLYGANQTLSFDRGGWYSNPTNQTTITVGYDCLMLFNFITMDDGGGVLFQYPSIDGTSVITQTENHSGGTNDFLLRLKRGQTVIFYGYNPSGGSVNLKGNATTRETQLRWGVVSKL